MRDADWPAMWEIVRPVLRAGETYTVDPHLDEDAARDFWCGPPSTAVTVAEAGGTILGTAHMGPNRGGPGAHVANASYMVGEAARGRGVGRALVLDSLERLAAQGFESLVFNAVAASNRGAVRLYLDLGFTILGSVPGGFRHPREGLVDLHVMHRALR
nr:GNAT family N-acetyltransferase [Wenxinia saemankumensis]